MDDKKQNSKFKPTLGITIGDINGIGPEVIIKCLLDPKLYQYANIVVYGHGKVLSHYKKLLDIEDFSFYQFKPGDHLNQRKANVINCWEDHIDVKPGEENSDGGKCALLAIQKAVEDLKDGFIQGVVTAPISKHNIQSSEFNFPGHTEYFTKEFEAKDSLMFLCSERLKIGVVTGHIPLMQVGEALTPELLNTKIQLMLKSLKKDFGYQKPKIAVLGLNPHAGEDGLLGSEEKEKIAPVITEFKEKGNLVFGPYPADGFFGNNSHSKFDGILAMYHDQGLVPFKALAFEEGVNFTAGLSIVRTSPDHGTAFNIAGKSIANESSMRYSIFMAIDIIRERNSANI
jgi:4-hydroxythreonine-4-phosphate dehydrogenase